ncbi:hypothetical protein [Deinococcus soli (ex Cha et al. 2016)]|uniref:Permease n=2 Tax=Deinococcus soli (ex Cha et al. 2016) TaxID=1309411 RepID=A0AAE3XEH5_9DEIO|nr:hypothetical protein [Deinococcus soli (ex Cha et al. 2016)]MDR6219927.1 putative permease [Deinococcus soli (ex Cha et al. 2016)]MDR6329815.1 putative permease [Deinococcus soli (ex Cha et al. 2016)]MDR6752834.1 putative permease [Deinococcus soli (ex Cha et al. 2016)]
MNTTLSLGSLAVSSGILAAGLIFMYGVWLGRRDTGWRAAQGVLGAVVLGGVLPFLLIQFAPALLSYDSRNLTSLFLLTIVNIVGVLVAFLPWLVAGNWLEILRREGPST